MPMVLLPSRDDKRQRVCGDPVETALRYCPIHDQEMVNSMASNESGIWPEERESKL
jgi:hypothetical protein